MARWKGRPQGCGIDQVKCPLRPFVSLVKNGRALQESSYTNTCNIILKTHSNPLKTLSSQRKRLSFREVKQLASDHTATEWWGDGGWRQVSNLCLIPTLLLSTEALSTETAISGLDSKRWLVPLASGSEGGREPPPRWEGRTESGDPSRKEEDRAKGFVGWGALRRLFSIKGDIFKQYLRSSL